MRIERFFILFLLCGWALCAQALKTPSAERKDVAWQHHETLDVTLTMAKQHIISRWRKDGYSLKHTIELDRREGRCIMLWIKGKEQIMVMLWKIDTNQTGCSWGKVKQ
ncbi:MAG: hypothetical protein K5787_06295 [Lentisphaeria bacterium]|nr:hypothetical protein [Lentisphaeria bacterium]